MTDKHVISIDPAGLVFVDGEAIGTRMTRNHERYLRAVFAARQLATREFILSFVYGGRDEPDIKMVDVIICHVRNRLSQHRIAIRTEWGRGFSVHPAYALAAAEHTVGVNIYSDLIEELSQATGEEPAVLVTRLLKDEQKRVWEAA